MRFRPAFLLMLLTLALPLTAPARADDVKPDDTISFDLSTEGWVTTRTARVIVGVEAAVTGGNTATLRGDMQTALAGLARTDWRLTAFNRSQDSTGLERWDAAFEARLPESGLAGIHDNVKKVSKPGMQLTVSAIDFSPTLEEIEAVKSQLRTQLYKQAAEQTATLNAAFPGRTYRIANISFSGGAMPVLYAARAKTMALNAAAPEAVDTSGPMERAQKITMNAQVTFAALAPTGVK